MIVVLDTNVLVSGLLQAYGPPGEIVRLVAGGKLQLCYDTRILCEYREVLARPKFAFRPDDVECLLDQIKREGLAVVGEPLKLPLPDRNDEAFLEVALAGRAECLISGNAKHFPKNRTLGMSVLPPAAFLRYYCTRKQTPH